MGFGDEQNPPRHPRNPFSPPIRRDATFLEGCLSLPGYMALIERALEVAVTGTDEWEDPLVWRARRRRRWLTRHPGGTERAAKSTLSRPPSFRVHRCHERHGDSDRPRSGEDRTQLRETG
jgi:hypothetical protein